MHHKLIITTALSETEIHYHINTAHQIGSVLLKKGDVYFGLKLLTTGVYVQRLVRLWDEIKGHAINF
jgi:hypothetical protein